MRTLISLVLLLTACGARPPGPDPLAAVTLPPLPDWTDKYADRNAGDMRFFNISALMSAHGLSRLEAVEVQNHYRDLSRAAAPGGPGGWFAAALERVKAGELESGLDQGALEAAKFIVVFDLDDTLYDQYYDAGAPACADVAYTRADGEPAHIKLAPGWAEAIRRLHGLGGQVVIFSANRDTPTRENLTHWTLDQVPLIEHPAVAGVLTNSYLVQQHKLEGKKKAPVVQPSKDLRMFDEALRKVIIVDDNPTRLFQLRNTRLFKKLHGEVACGRGDPALAAAYQAALPAVVAEIEDSLGWMEAHPEADFVTAYLPFSMLGAVAVQALTTGGARTRVEAIDYIRAHPGVVDRKF